MERNNPHQPDVYQREELIPERPPQPPATVQDTIVSIIAIMSVVLFFIAPGLLVALPQPWSQIGAIVVVSAPASLLHWVIYKYYRNLGYGYARSFFSAIAGAVAFTILFFLGLGFFGG